MSFSRKIAKECICTSGFAVNGLFLSQNSLGITRYATELMRQVDQLAMPDEIVVVAPDCVGDSPYENLKLVRYGGLRGVAWEQINFPHWLCRQGLRAISLCNVAPVIAPPGVTVIHDIMYHVCPEFYVTPRNRVSRLWHCLQYTLLTHRELALPTVSEFSRHEIERCYPEARGKVSIVPDAWQHVLDYEEATDWRDRYPELLPGEFLFTMATLARNKNGRWVYEVARRNPDITFAIAGKRYESDEVVKPSNVLLLGFVSDADACALMRNCRAFLFPSLYEGFGLPPLEALALGTQVVASRTTSLPEVLGGCVHYIDPEEYEVDVEGLLAEPVTPAKEALERFSWESSAEALLRLVRGLL